MKASEANLISKTKIEEFQSEAAPIIREKLKAIYKEIEEAASEGAFSIRSKNAMLVPMGSKEDKFNELLIRTLKENGYKISYDFTDIIINWEKPNE